MQGLPHQNLRVNITPRGPCACQRVRDMHSLPGWPPALYLFCKKQGGGCGALLPRSCSEWSSRRAGTSAGSRALTIHPSLGLSRGRQRRRR